MPRPSRAQSAGRSALLLLAGLAAFVLASQAIHRLKPFPRIPVVREKLRHFEGRKDEFDALFIGSSRIVHGVMSRRFDAAMAEQGFEIHSFNLGLDAMVAPESLFVLDRVLKMNPRRLRYVFLEFGALQTKVDRDTGSVRATYWRDWEQTALIWRANYQSLARRSSGRSPAAVFLDSYRQMEPHLGLFFRNQLNLGRGLEILTNTLSPPITADAVAGPDGDGFVPLPERAELREADREILLQRIPLMKTEKRCKDVRAARERWARVIRELAARQIGVIFVVPPTTWNVPRFDPRFRRGGLAATSNYTLIALDDVTANPQLFDLSARVDYEHLNARGAREMTRLVAEKFGAWLREREGRTNP